VWALVWCRSILVCFKFCVTACHPRKIPGSHLCWRRSLPQGHNVAERIRSTENSSYLIICVNTNGEYGEVCWRGSVGNMGFLSVALVWCGSILVSFKFCVTAYHHHHLVISVQ
jgi:hypothetical protein